MEGTEYTTKEAVMKRAQELDFYVGQDDVPVALRAPWESNKGTYIAVA